MINILYIVSLEHMQDNGIIRSQVINFLKILSRKFNINAILLYIVPVLVINKKSIVLNPMVYKKNRIEIIKYLQLDGVKIIFFPFYIPMIGMYGIYLHPIYLTIFLLYCLPYVVYCVYKHNINIIHARAYLSGLISVLTKSIKSELKVIFDPRGFAPEEGAEHGLWSERSISYKLWKLLERFIIKKSDVGVSLSNKFGDHLKEIHSNGRVELVYASVNVNEFKIEKSEQEKLRKEMRVSDKLVFAFVGGLGTWNDPEIIVALFSYLKRNIDNSFLLLLTSYPIKKLDIIFKKYGLNDETYFVKECKPDEVPRWLGIVDIGILPGRKFKRHDKLLSLTNNTMIGLKVGEYFASGLPVLVNYDFEALRSLVTENDLGFTFKCKDDIEIESINLKNIQKLENRKHLSDNCRRISGKYFSANTMADKYHAIYVSLIN